MLQSLKHTWLFNIRGDVLAGLVVALALIPEAIAFSIIAGVDPKVGLYASFCIAVVIAFVGGRPGMISAATGFQLEQVEEAIQDFHKMMVDTNALHDKRATQAKQWMQSHFQRNLIAEMEAHPDIQKQIVDAFKSLETGATTPRAAADSLISSIKYEIRPN